ncbi:beta-galactoside-binding lectin-like [Salminus brasiliensis]|uniref:beta-galactoside-binding lectin-like n=1 Tax=Salminus brasiliensis TaxID=930266 RepID=UPI003B8381B9
MAPTVSDMRFVAGQELSIIGRIKADCDFFSINIGHDPNNIALHFNPRFKYNKDRKVIVCNSNRGGWGSEQKESNFPFQRDADFKVVFNFNNDQFFIRLPDGSIITFPNRFGDDRFTHLQVDGDVKIHSFKII